MRAAKAAASGSATCSKVVDDEEKEDDEDEDVDMDEDKDKDDEEYEEQNLFIVPPQASADMFRHLSNFHTSSRGMRMKRMMLRTSSYPLWWRRSTIGNYSSYMFHLSYNTKYFLCECCLSYL